MKSIGQSDKGEYTCTVVQGSNSVARSVTIQVQGTYCFKRTSRMELIRFSALHNALYILHILVPPRIERFDFPLNLQEGWRARVTCAAPIGDLPIR